MHHKAVESLLNAKPFYPIRLHMTARYSVEIHRPEWVKLTDSSITLQEPDPADPTKLRWKSILSLDHVVSMEQIRPDEPTIVTGK